VCWETFFAKGSVSGSRIQHRESCSAAFPKPVACERLVKERVGACSGTCFLEVSPHQVVHHIG
jgi:hypothetical protein